MEYHSLVILGSTCGKKEPKNARAANMISGMSIAIRCISSYPEKPIERPPFCGGLSGLSMLRLLGGSGLACVRLGELAAETLDASGGVDQLLLTGEERVAGGADFENNVALVRGAGLEVSSAGALNGDGLVLRVNSLLRHNDPFAGRSLRRRI